MNILNSFIQHLEEQLDNHSIYVWGAQGQQGEQITEAWIRRRETSAKNAERVNAFWKKQIAAGYGKVLRAFDCSGLLMYWLQNVTGLSKGDRNADGLMAACKRIKKSECRRGDWVFHLDDEEDDATHIGVIVDDDLNVIECKGRDYGVVKRPLNAGGWEAFGRPRIFEKYILEGKQQAAADQQQDETDQQQAAADQQQAAADQQQAETDQQQATAEKSNEEAIFSFLRNEMKLNAAASCGVLANIEKESAFQNNVPGDNGTSFWICQWHASRYERLKAWSTENGKDFRALDTQLWYLKYELEKYYKAVVEYIRGVGNTEQGAFKAGNRWCMKFEVPANAIVKSVERGEIARDKYWPKYGEGAAASGAAWIVKRVLKYTIPYMKGEDVKALQTALIAAGFDCGAGGADGVFGASTNNAVAQYQQAHGLQCDAKAGRQTITALGGTFEE